MFEYENMPEKIFNDETHRIVGEVELQHYGKLLDAYNSKILLFKQKLPNNFNIRSDPIFLDNSAFEDTSLLELIRTDNKLLSRLLISIAVLCEEIHLLVTEAQNDFYKSLVCYEEGISKSENNLKSISKLLHTSQRIHFFVTRSQQVITLLLSQVCSIMGDRFYPTTTSFPEPLECLSELLVCLLILDNLLTSSSLREHFSLYCRTVRIMLHTNSKSNISEENLRLLHANLSQINNSLFTGSILKNVLEHCLNKDLLVDLKWCNLQNELGAYINQMLTDLEQDDENILFTQIWLEVNVMFVFDYYLYGNLEKKVYKRLLEVNKKVSACTLYGNVLWYPEAFLLKHVPPLAKHLDVKSLANCRLTQIATKSQNLPRDTHILCMQACDWMLEVERLNTQNMNAFNVKNLQEKCSLLTQGIKLMKKISELVKWITNLHAAEGRPMVVSVLLALCKLIEVLKSFQFIFHKNILPLVYISLLVCQQLTHKLLTLVHNLKKSFTQSKSYKEQQLDVLSALTLAEQTLKGPNTYQRILVFKLALSSSGLSYDQLLELRSVVNRLELISCLHKLLFRLCDCSFLNWHEALLPVYFSKLVESKASLSRFYMFVAALTDSTTIAEEKIYTSTDNYLKTNLLQPLNQIIETNLRLQTHLHLQLPTSNPFQNLPPFTFKKLLPACLKRNYINIVQEIEHYLSTMFYNLVTVVLHDWRTYGEMRRLALLQYNLNTVEDSLPMQTLEQGLDALEIMRNIHIFVGKYLYNLNNQVFVEDWSNNKHLNTINISHVANSIRTHGIGIMNTTVNFIYQFLQNKFFIFSQFMYDEHIKSRLLKDLKFFTEHKLELNQMYPYERAEKFNFAIRKLGLNENGQSYLDLFRKLITQIGNAMGYIRLIRSGGRRCLADGTCFIPDLKCVEDLTTLLEECDLQNVTKDAAKCLRQDLNGLIENFEEATEYFKLLVKVFAPVFRNAQNLHLRNFYMIIPPLTINFVEHSLICKEKLNKKNRAGAAFTDDGFAMGLAYIVELLEQTNNLNSIHWFHSVQNKFAQDTQNLNAQKAVASKEDQKLQQTLALTEKRIKSVNREFQLLFYSYSSARMFFHS